METLFEIFLYAFYSFCFKFPSNSLASFSFSPTQQGVNKGLIAERLLATMKQKSMLPDFVLCIGDDRSDEDMFKVIMSSKDSLSPVAEVFACTVGQKPSKAKYYLEDTTEILRMLQGLANASEQAARNAAPWSSQRVVIA